MKRVLLALVVVALAAMPAAGRDRFINLGYNIQRYGETDFSRRGIGLVYTCMRGDAAGFYAQVAPFLALSSKSGGFVFKYLENNVYGGGLNLTLGYGKDVDLGTMGVLVGGGLFASAYASYDTDWEYLYWESAFGVGGGAHLYFKPGAGNLVINVGLDAAWRPAVLWGSSDYGFEEFLFESRDLNFNLNAGIGFRL